MKTEARRYTQTARAQNAEATARRIVDAFLLRFMQQWFDEITLDRVAEDAGVTVQTVVRRFGGKEGLLAEAVQIMGAQINARRASNPGDLDHLVHNLINDYEHTGDAVIRLLALEPRHPVLTKVLDFGRGQHRAWVAATFAPPLDKLKKELRDGALDSLVIVTDVYVWKLLRRDLQRSLAEATATMKSLLQAALSNLNSGGEKP